MSLRGDFFQSSAPDNIRVDIDRLYKLLETTVNSSIDVKTFESSSGTNLATIEGGTTPGVGTYTRQQGLYVRSGSLVTYWFAFTWTAHTGNGDIRIVLPYNSRFFDGDFIGEVESESIAWPASVTQIKLKLASETAYATVFGTGSGIAGSAVSLPGSGTLNGHIRYIAESQS